MTVEHSSLEDRAREAAVRRYKPLDAHMSVALSGRMPHESLRPATDAAVGLVRRELESTYAALLEANAARDEARSLASALLGVVREFADDMGRVAEYNPNLEWERLPYWLTRETGAPEEWDRGDD